VTGIEPESPSNLLVH